MELCIKGNHFGKIYLYLDHALSICNQGDVTKLFFFLNSISPRIFNLCKNFQIQTCFAVKTKFTLKILLSSANLSCRSKITPHVDQFSINYCHLPLIPFLFPNSPYYHATIWFIDVHFEKKNIKPTTFHVIHSAMESLSALACSKWPTRQRRVEK